MGWDSSRPVPWQRLIREWLLYAGIMSAIFVVFFRGNNVVGAIAGVLISGPLYLTFGAVLAKFGYQRQRLKDIRAKSETDQPSPSATSASSSGAGERKRPAPTSRTGGGGRHPKAGSKRKR